MFLMVLIKLYMQSYTVKMLASRSPLLSFKQMLLITSVDMQGLLDKVGFNWYWPDLFNHQLKYEAKSCLQVDCIMNTVSAALCSTVGLHGV